MGNKIPNIPVYPFLFETGREKNQRSNSASESPKIKETERVVIEAEFEAPERTDEIWEHPFHASSPNPPIVDVGWPLEV